MSTCIRRYIVIPDASIATISLSTESVDVVLAGEWGRRGGSSTVLNHNQLYNKVLTRTLRSPHIYALRVFANFVGSEEAEVEVAVIVTRSDGKQHSRKRTCVMKGSSDSTPHLTEFYFHTMLEG